VQSGKTASTVDFLMEKKVPGGGAFTIESEYAATTGLAAITATMPKAKEPMGLHHS
jgi:hypothetical protein